jgi:hypothetical protein
MAPDRSETSPGPTTRWPRVFVLREHTGTGGTDLADDLAEEYAWFEEDPAEPGPDPSGTVRPVARLVPSAAALRRARTAHPSGHWART